MPGIASRLRRLTERRPPTPKERHRAWWSLLAAMIVLQAWGAIALFRTEAWSSASATATGTVVGHVSGDDVKLGRVHREIVEFTAPGGAPTRFVESAPRTVPFEKGAQVPVRFRSSDPTDARIDSAFRIWEGPAMLIGIGAAGTVLLSLLRRRLPPIGGPDASADASEVDAVDAELSR